MNWDLSALYIDDEALEVDVKRVEQKAKTFESLYKNRLKILSTTDFLEALSEYEALSQTFGKFMTYAFLKFATDSSNGGFYAKYQNAYANISEHTLFFELEFNKLTKAKQQEFIEVASIYKYFLTSLLEQKPYQLSSKEERILLKKDNTSASAWSRLFDEHFSRLKFDFDGEQLCEEEVLSKMHNSNREVRKKAANSLSKTLKKHQDLIAYIYNMIKADHKVDCELRGYKSPETFRHMHNKISQKSVDALVKSTEESFSLVHEYYAKKAELLGLEKLYDYDRYAPLSSKEREYDFESSKAIVLSAFEKFSPKMAYIAQKAFDEKWIDVFPKEGKRGGAFSHPATPDAHPYVLLNHTNQRRDLFTMAHELGHAIHQYLSRNVGYLGTNTPLTTSETASVFAEMLVFDSIKDDLNETEKIALYASKIEDIFATLYRQINFTTFERAVHASDGELKKEDFNALWMAESKKMFGSSVVLSKNYEIWWSYIPHFIHSPFYCYSYSYGQLLVLALYGLYKSGKTTDFVENYSAFLSAGGSKSPKELIERFGFDIESVEFWKIGITEIKKLLNEFKGLQDASRTFK